MSDFVYDLRAFRYDSKAQAQLDTIEDASYTGMRYVEPSEAQQRKACIVDASNNKSLEWSSKMPWKNDWREKWKGGLKAKTIAFALPTM